MRRFHQADRLSLFHNLLSLITETPRLLLREFNAADAGHLYDLNHDPEVLKYTGDRPFADLADAARFLEQYKDYDLYGMGRWAVVLKSTRAFTGWCGLKYRPDLGTEGEVDLGYRFFRKYWGKGFATETARRCVDYGFEQLHLKRIIGRSAIANAASVKVLEKCGLKFECFNHHFAEESVQFAMSLEDYKAFRLIR